MNAFMKSFQIEIAGLQEGLHHYSFTIDDMFFKALEQQLLEKGSLDVAITLGKSSLMINAEFEIKGWVELLCDRSLNKFEHPINTYNSIVFKFSDKNEELTDEIILIKEGTPFIDVSHLIFDFIALNIPLKKIHPDFLTDADRNSEDDILIYSSVNNENDLTDNNIDILDPRWEALKKLKDAF